MEDSNELSRVGEVAYSMVTAMYRPWHRGMDVKRAIIKTTEDIRAELASMVELEHNEVAMLMSDMGYSVVNKLGTVGWAVVED